MMSNRARPNSIIGGYWDGPPIAREVSELRLMEQNRIGCEVLRDRTASAIVDYADRNRLTVAHAMNTLLYAGELQ
jgi:hypothetical protein